MDALWLFTLRHPADFAAARATATAGAGRRFLGLGNSQIRSIARHKRSKRASEMRLLGVALMGRGRAPTRALFSPGAPCRLLYAAVIPVVIVTGPLVQVAERRSRFSVFVEVAVSVLIVGVVLSIYAWRCFIDVSFDR